MTTENMKSDRRSFLKSAVATAAASAGLSMTMVQQAWAEAGDSASSLDMNYIRALVDTIFPRTETPSASDVGVHDFIGFMHENWFVPEDKKNFDQGLADLQEAANSRYGDNFENLDPKIQHLLLSQFELESLRYRNFFAGPSLNEGEAPLVGKPFFYRLKDLVIVGYFTSEEGIAAHLLHDPIPGGFDGKAPYDTSEKGNYRYYLDEQILQGV